MQEMGQEGGRLATSYHLDIRVCGCPGVLHGHGY